MEFKTTKFDVEASGLNYYLGIRSSVDIDYWVNKDLYNKWIEWKATIISNSQGITNLYGFPKSVLFAINFRVDLDDISDNEEKHLLKNFDCSLHENYIDGYFVVDTIKDTEWQIEFNVEPKPSIVPSELLVNFMDKLMEVV